MPHLNPCLQVQIQVHLSLYLFLTAAHHGWRMEETTFLWFVLFPQMTFKGKQKLNIVIIGSGSSVLCFCAHVFLTFVSIQRERLCAAAGRSPGG